MSSKEEETLEWFLKIYENKHLSMDERVAALKGIGLIQGINSLDWLKETYEKRLQFPDIKIACIETIGIIVSQQK